MKPDHKEKAVELVKISFDIIVKSVNYKPVQKDGGKSFYAVEKIAKKIALKYVDEIINENHLLDNYHCDFTEKLVIRAYYWNEVKSKLEKL